MFTDMTVSRLLHSAPLVLREVSQIQPTSFLLIALTQFSFLRFYVALVCHSRTRNECRNTLLGGAGHHCEYGHRTCKHFCNVKVTGQFYGTGTLLGLR